MNACRAGQVALPNDIVTGNADDKEIYAYVPQLIRYYLGEDPILPNVNTELAHDETHRKHILANIETSS